MGYCHSAKIFVVTWMMARSKFTLEKRNEMKKKVKGNWRLRNFSFILNDPKWSFTLQSQVIIVQCQTFFLRSILLFLLSGLWVLSNYLATADWISHFFFFNSQFQLDLNLEKKIIFLFTNKQHNRQHGTIRIENNHLPVFFFAQRISNSSLSSSEAGINFQFQFFQEIEKFQVFFSSLLACCCWTISHGFDWLDQDDDYFFTLIQINRFSTI